MESPIYRETLVRLYELAAATCGEKALYSKGEAAQILGVSRSTVHRRKYPFKRGYITLEALAKELAKC